MFFMIASSYFFHMHVLLFILVFLPLLYSLLLVTLFACTFVACFSINAQYSISNHYLFMLGLIVIRLLVFAQWRREGGRGCNVPGTVVGTLGEAACFDKK